MMHLTIVAVGKLKETYWTAAIKEYSKRMSRYAKLTIVEVADEKAADHLSIAEIDSLKDKEAQRVLKKIPANDFIVTLEITGQALSSKALAKKINQLAVSGHSNISFVIGGSHGLSAEVTARSQLAISFGKMTYPHQIMRLLLLEQLYRSFKIINNEPYHK